MRSHEFRLPLHIPLKALTLCSVLYGITGSIAHSQESPAPPIPHTRPVLPGTHVPPQPVLQKSGIVMHIDGPTIVNQKRCAQHTFDLKYSVINHLTEPANGTVRASFNGVWLTAMESAKVSNLPPGKATSGSFAACCPSSGLFTARMEYRDDTSQAHDKTTEQVHQATDSVNISCK